jgi:hypothetical protein
MERHRLLATMQSKKPLPFSTGRTTMLVSNIVLFPVLSKESLFVSMEDHHLTEYRLHTWGVSEH